MGDEYNMSIRKFLKQVGVTSQRAIEDGLRDSGEAGKTYTARVVLTVEGLEIEHVVEGEIRSDEA